MTIHFGDSTSIDSGGSLGKIVQLVAGTAKTAAFSTTSTSDVQVTGLTCQITPTSSSNKILVHLVFFLLL